MTFSVKKVLPFFLIMLLTTTAYLSVQAQSLKMGKEAYVELKRQFDNSEFSSVYAQHTSLTNTKVDRLGHEICAVTALTPSSRVVYMRALTRKQVNKKAMTQQEAKLFVRIQEGYANKNVKDMFKAAIDLINLDRKSNLVIEYCRQLDNQSRSMGYDNARDMYNDLSSMYSNMSTGPIDEISFPFEDPNVDITDPMGMNCFMNPPSYISANTFDLSGSQNVFGNGALNAAGGGSSNEGSKYHIDEDEEKIIVGVSTLGYGTIGAAAGFVLGGAGGAAAGFGVGATAGVAIASTIVGGFNTIFSGSVVDPCAMNGNDPANCPPGIGY